MIDPDPRLIPLLDLGQLDAVTVTAALIDGDSWSFVIATELCTACEDGAHATADGWLQLELLAHAATGDGLTLDAHAAFPAGDPGGALRHVLRGRDDDALARLVDYLHHLTTEVFTRSGDAP